MLTCAWWLLMCVAVRLHGVLTQCVSLIRHSLNCSAPDTGQLADCLVITLIVLLSLSVCLSVCLSVGIE